MRLENIKREVLHYFRKQQGMYVDQMRGTLHSHSPKEINPFHMEDDVWSHSILVLNQYIHNLGNGGDYDTKDPILLNNIKKNCVLCLAHDIGKCFTRTPRYGKVYFTNHGFSSVSTLYEIYLDACEYGLLDYNSVDLYHILSIASNHNMLYDVKELKDLLELCNYDSELGLDFLRLGYADQQGRFLSPFHKDESSIPYHMYYELLKSYNLNHQENTPNDSITVTIIGGPPGCGKTHYIKNFDGNSISFDDIRIEKYKQSHPNSEELDSKELYNKAFEYSHKKINLLSEFTLKLIELRNNVIKDIYVDNVNLSIKSRKELIYCIRKVFRLEKLYFKYILILNKREKCVINDIKRNDKTVGEKIINKFWYNMSIPTFSEGFDHIEIVDNSST